MNLKYLSKYFPPPRFLKPPHIGISFSDASIKAIYFEDGSGPNFKSAIISVDKGSIVMGSIVKMDEVVKRLEVARKNFDSPFVFFTVPDELSYVFSASVPTQGGDITEAIAFVMEENVPLPLGEVVFDFVPTAISGSDPEYTATATVSACVKKEVEKFMEALRKAGFEPVGCIHESAAVAKSVIPKNFRGTYSVIHARESKVGIYLVKNKIVHFSTIRNILNGNYKEEFLDEYGKFLEYCSHYDAAGADPIRAALVCGEFENAQMIIEAINGSKFPKEVKLSNVWTNAFEIDRYTPDIPFEKSLSFAGSVGAALSPII